MESQQLSQHSPISQIVCFGVKEEHWKQSKGKH